MVSARRRVERRQPDRIDSELREVGQARPDAGQVTDAVAVFIRKAAYVDLVDDRVSPPGLGHASSAWSSERVGIALRPSSARHESDAAVFAARSACSSGAPSTRYARSAPWKTSPAPSVLTH